VLEENESAKHKVYDYWEAKVVVVFLGGRKGRRMYQQKPHKAMKMKSKVTGRGEKIKEINSSCDGLLNLVRGDSRSLLQSSSS